MDLTLSELKNDLLQKRFIKNLITEYGAEIYFVGGIVRDVLLAKPNKDIDLVIRKINIDNLVDILNVHGKVDIVGKSFGIIKFKAYEDDVEYDIALPRQEVATGEGGHKGFSVNYDENLPIEKDLIRRDFKINAMAVLLNDGSFIDPLGGLDDIKNKQVSMANPDSFSDDPLRMLRAIGFASRFRFEIESNTFTQIQKHASKIKQISPERIIIEFDKIVKKGNQELAATYIYDSGILEMLMNGRIIPYKGDLWQKSKTMAEFIFLLLHSSIYTLPEWFKKEMKGDIDTFNELRALHHGWGEKRGANSLFLRSSINAMYRMYPESIKSKILAQSMQDTAKDMMEGKYPLSLKEMQLNGDELIEMGYVGKQVGDILNGSLVAIYNDTVLNNKEDLRIFVAKIWKK